MDGTDGTTGRGRVMSKAQTLGHDIQFHSQEVLLLYGL
jgi:hypothetical protein